MSQSSDASVTSSAPGPNRLSLMAAVSIVVLLAHGPMLASLGRRMWESEHYSFFPLILLGGGFLGWQRYRGYVDQRAGATWDAGFRSPWLWGISILLLALAVAAHSPWPAGVGCLLAVRAAINSLFAEELARRLMPAWWFLWLAIPLPLNFDRHLILAMQLLATKLASGVLDLGGIRHSLSGVVIKLPGKSFFVEEACSGIQSLFAAISVTVFYSMLGRRGLLRTLLLSVCGIGWVLVANALRIIGVTVLSTRYGLPIDQGWAHEATGAVVFVTAMLLIVSTDRFLLFLAPLRERGAFEKTEPHKHSAHRHRRRRSFSSRWTFASGIAAAAVFGILGVVQLTHAIPNQPREFILGRDQQRVEESTLPAEWNGWERQAFTIVEREASDPNGQISRVWRYERSGQSVAYSLDGPFNAWHDLGLCYTSQGWTVGHEIDHTQQTDEGLRYDYSELTQEDEEGRHAYVLFSAFNDSGEPVSPPPFFRAGVGMRFPDASILVQRMKDGLSGRPRRARYGGTVYQTQAYVEAQSLLTDAERRIVRELFQHLTRRLQTRLEQETAASAPAGLAGSED